MWKRQCVVCWRPNRPIVYCRRLAPFGLIALCEVCRRRLLSELLAAADPASLSETLAILRWLDVERREDANDG